MKYNIKIPILVILSCSVFKDYGFAASMEKDVAEDRFSYLEEVQGDKALEWVREQNAVTVQRLSKDERLKAIEAILLAELKNPKNIAFPQFSDSGKIENFWIDDVHKRGLWRETDWDLYAKGQPRWDTLLDVDSLSEKEGRNWVYKGAQCLPSEPNRCLILLSDGGKDAVSIREFDTISKRFVEGGFELSEAKQDVSWLDKDTLYVSREWKPGEVTDSGYAYVTKRLTRGQTLDQAVEIFRGDKTDISASRDILRDMDGSYVLDYSTRSISDDKTEQKFLTKNGDVSLPLPLSSYMIAYQTGQIIYRLKDDWVSAGGQSYKANSIISFDLFEALKSPEKIEPLLVFKPAFDQSVESVSETKSHLIIHTLTNVMGELHVFTFKGGAWSSQKLPLGDNQSVSVIAADDKSDSLFVTVESFLQPVSLYHINAGTLEIRHLASEPAQFSSADMQVQQNWVTSKDGTKIPYFIVAKKNIKFDDHNPTLMTAYGGFEISSTPSYLGSFGKIWLEKGGVYVLANIRGGGEFGRDWHKAAVKTKRQNSFDDFQAVAEDLIARKITSPAKLGIKGGSNGGLLMGVQLIQRPELWGAVIIDVPLLDMVRYNRLLAGASWMSEYGDPDDPIEGKFLKSISPYHNLKAGTIYPEPFFMTTTLDDRVHPAHARKMAAKMQAMNMPFLYYENKDGGHGSAATAVDSIKVQAMEYVYLLQKLFK